MVHVKLCCRCVSANRLLVNLGTSPRMVADAILRRTRRRKGPAPKTCNSEDARQLLFGTFFHTEPPLTAYELVKILALSWWLPVVRILAFWTLMFVFLGASRVVCIGVDRERLSPHSVRKRILRHQSLFGCRLATWLAGFRIRAHGQAAGPTGDWHPPIISNHISMADIPVLATQGHTAFVAKAGISKVPILRGIAARWQVVTVKRKSSGSRQQLQDDLWARCCDVDAPRPVLFSEGSTTNGRGIMKFRHGIFRLGKPVQPVLLHYPNRHCSLAWDTCTISFVLWRSLTQLTIPVDIYYLDLYTPSDDEKADPALFAENVRQAMYTFAATQGIKLQPTEANVMEKLIYQDYADGKLTWGAVLIKMDILYREKPDNYPPEKFAALRRACAASGFVTPAVGDEAFV